MKVLFGVLVGIVIVGSSMFMMKKEHTPVSVVEAPSTQNPTDDSMTDEEKVIATWYAPLTSFTLGRISLQASIADTDAERTKGLSDTPYIPIGIAKVFIFDSADIWPFWMKDMNYPIDIFWLDENGHVVHVVENAQPDSYPEISFAPPVPAKYVVETKAGFARENNIGIGAVAGMTEILRQ